MTVDTLTFGLTVTPNNGAPALTGQLKFTDDTAAGGGSALGTTATQIVPFWQGLNPVLRGTSEVAAIGFIVPASAAAAQSYSVTITGVSAALGFTLVSVSRPSAPTTVSVSGVLTIAAPSTLPVGTVGVAYPPTTIIATGGAASYAFSATGLPAGLTVSSQGVIGGTPATHTGSPYSVTVKVTDSASTTAIQSYSLTIDPALSIAGPVALPTGTAQTAYPYTTLTAAGGSGIYTWSAVGLPNGMTIGSTSGVLSGTPASAFHSSVTVTVTDSNSATSTRSYNLVIDGSLSITGPSTIPAATLNTAYPSTLIVGGGGSGVYTWSATGLPNGMGIGSSTGILSGVPTTNTGSPYSVTVTVTDSAGATATRIFTLVVNLPLSISGPASLPTGIIGTAYAPTTGTATGGSGVYTWSATGLPDGLGINSATGTIGGTPANNTGSPYSVAITARDSTGATATKIYTLVVYVPLSILQPVSLPAGTVGTAYTAAVTASGGTGVYTWSATGLPGGLTIGSSTGVISGSPAANTAGPYVAVVTATDSNSATATRIYPMTVNPGTSALPLAASVSTSAGGQAVVAPNTYISIYGANFTPAGFTDDWSHSIANGNLPIVLDGVKVSIGGLAAYVSYVSATQINVLCPNVGFGPLQVTVTTGAGDGAPYLVTSQQLSPAFFSWPNDQPVATHLDYTPAAANGTFAGTSTLPAKPGEVIILWGAGFGPTTPSAPFGVATPGATTYNTASDVGVTLNGVPLQVYNNTATLAPGYAGLFQVAVTIPASLPSGSYAITTGVNGVTSPRLMLTVHE